MVSSQQPMEYPEITRSVNQHLNTLSRKDMKAFSVQWNVGWKRSNHRFSACWIGPATELGNSVQEINWSSDLGSEIKFSSARDLPFHSGVIILSCISVPQSMSIGVCSPTYDFLQWPLCRPRRKTLQLPLLNTKGFCTQLEMQEAFSLLTMQPRKHMLLCCRTFGLIKFAKSKGFFTSRGWALEWNQVSLKDLYIAMHILVQLYCRLTFVEMQQLQQHLWKSKPNVFIWCKTRERERFSVVCCSKIQKARRRHYNFRHALKKMCRAWLILCTQKMPMLQPTLPSLQ